MILKTDLIQKIMNDIAPQHFDADAYSEVTKSRTGMFAVIAETLGTVFENSVVAGAIRAREMHTATASRETLIQEAATYPDLTLPNATPAVITIALGIPTEYLRANFMTSATTLEFVLGADTIISISDVKFMLPYDIKISARYTAGKLLYGAQYMMTGDNPLYTSNNPLIATTRKIEASEYLMITLTLFQLEKQYQYYNVIETDQLFLNGFDFKYEGELAYFNVYYKAADSTEYSPISKMNYRSKMTGNGTYVYYDNATPGLIRLYVPDTFTPGFNSEFRVDIYTTLGDKGNFTYRSGDVSIIPQTYGDTIDYTGSYFYPVVATNSIGGTASLGTEDIRKLIITYKSTLRSMDTELDLNNYFSTIDEVDNMVFIKKRIDIFEKQFTAFMIMRDAESNIIPTNSLNARLTDADIDAHYVQTKRRIIKPTAAYSLTAGNHFVVEKNNTPLTPALITQLENDTSKFLFGCPYLIVINEDPPSTSMYMNSVSNLNLMQLDYSNDDAVIQFIINRMTMTRNAIAGENHYTITMNLIPASEIPPGVVDDGGNILDPDAIKVFGLVYSEDVDGEITGYFNMQVTSYNRLDNYFVAQGTMSTDDYITMEDKLRIINTVYQVKTTNTFDFITPTTNVRLGIGIYFKDPDGVFVDKGDLGDLIPGLDAYGLVNVYSNAQDRSVFMLNMSKMINAPVSLVDNGGGNVSFSLKQLPLIRYSDIRSNITHISEVIQRTNATITSMLQLIKNNSSIDFKFFATYGRSKYFTMGESTTLLDRLNISLRFRARVSSNRVDTTIVADIRSFIKPLVEEINVLDTSKSIYFSNIITQVENEFKYTQNRILSFELAGVNDYTTLYQAVVNNTKPVSAMTQDELLDYVAEFVKLDLDKITIDILLV
jgi:hypothetical protein